MLDSMASLHRTYSFFCSKPALFYIADGAANGAGMFFCYFKKKIIYDVYRFDIYIFGTLGILKYFCQKMIVYRVNWYNQMNKSKDVFNVTACTL
jgi:DNA-directed RNA polymerase subunit N (RpoN/RPB10)